MNTDDAELLARFRRSRDEADFRRLYRLHTPVLFALAMRLAGGARSDAEELTQEAWVRAVERLDRFAGRSSLRTWLSGILVNCYRERSRRQSRDPRQLDEATARRANLRLARPGERASGVATDVERALDRLPDGYREVVVLHDLYGYTHREIGERLEIAEGTSKSQLARGHARLRDLLGAPGTGNRDGERGSA